MADPLNKMADPLNKMVDPLNKMVDTLNEIGHERKIKMLILSKRLCRQQRNTKKNWNYTKMKIPVFP